MHDALCHELQIPVSQSSLQVLEFAVLHQCPLLASRVIAYVSTCCVALSARCDMFDSIAASDHRQDIIECMCDVICKHLPMKLNVECASRK